jgi:hypothetical protein
MITRYAASGDGLHWRDQGVALRGTPGGWDARGARITAILRTDPPIITEAALAAVGRTPC